MVVVLTLMAARHGLGVKYALLLRRKLGIEGLDRLAALSHPRVALICHGKHLVQALRRGQLGKLAAHGLPVHTHGMLTTLAGAGKGRPRSLLLRLELELFLQRGQVLGAMLLPPGVELLPVPGFAVPLASGAGGSHCKS